MDHVGMLAFVILVGGGVGASIVARVVDTAVRKGHRV